MVKKESNPRSNPESRERGELPQRAPVVLPNEYWLTITKGPHGTSDRMKSLVLLRQKDGVETRTVLYSSEKLYDLLDELQRSAYRIYGLNEVEEIVPEGAGK